MANDQSVQLPSIDEIANLPRWAAVAFAARCARRVQRLFVTQWPEADPMHVRALDNAITLGERAATEARADVEAMSAANAAKSAAFAAHAFHSAAQAANSAFHAARAVATSVAVPGVGTVFSADAFYAAALAADAADASASGNLARNIRHDFVLLVQQSKAQKWTDESSVSSEVFGPMWPDGEPSYWPWTKQPVEAAPSQPIHGASTHAGCPLSLYFSLTEFTPEEIVEMISDLSVLYRSIGGDRLVIEDASIMDPSLALQPAGGEP